MIDTLRRYALPAVLGGLLVLAAVGWFTARGDAGHSSTRCGDRSRTENESAQECGSNSASIAGVSELSVELGDRASTSASALSELK